VTALTFRLVRLAWILVAAAMIVIVAAYGERAETPSLVLALMSYPASLLANFVGPLPVRIAGLPDPEVLLVPLAMGALGFVQWFVIAPRIIAKLNRWHRITPATRSDLGKSMTARAVILLVIWLLAEITAIALSMSLNRVTERLPCHVSTILFHLWLAIPMSIAAIAGGLGASRVFEGQSAKLWSAALACLFVLASVTLQAGILFDSQSTANRIGAVIEAVMPGLLCFVIASYASRARRETALSAMQ